MSDVSSLSGISGLSFDPTLLSIFFLDLLLSPVTLSVLSFFCQLTHSPDFFPENSSTFFFVKREAFFVGFLFSSWEKLAGRW